MVTQLILQTIITVIGFMKKWENHSESMEDHTSILSGWFSHFFHLDIPFLGVKSLMKFDMLEGGFSLPMSTIAICPDVKKKKKKKKKYATTTLTYLYPILPFQSLLLMTPHSIYFYLSISSYAEF